MIHAPDGKLRFAPKDLVSYLEGDFAAWCDRMLGRARPERRHGVVRRAALGHARRGRGGELAGPEGPGARAALPRPLPREYPGLVEIALGDSDGRRAHPRRHGSRRARHLPGPARVRRLAGLSPTSSSAAPDGLSTAAATTTPRGTPSSPARPSPTSWSSSAPTPTCSRRSAATAPPSWSSSSATARSCGSAPADFFYYYRQLKRSFVAFQAGWNPDRAPDPGLDRGWGRWEKAAEQAAARVRPPEPRRQHHPRPGAAAGGGRDHHAHAPWPSASPIAASPNVSAPVFERLRAQARLQRRFRAATPSRSGSSRPPIRRRAAPWARAAAAAVRRRRVLRHGGLPVRRGRAGVPVRRGDPERAVVPRSTTGGPTTRPARGRPSRGSSTGSSSGAGARTRRSTSTTTPPTRNPR